MTGPEWLRVRLMASSPIAADAQAALLALPVTRKRYESGQYLLREGDRPICCSFLRSGFIYRHKIVGDGGRQIVSIHQAGDLIDVQQLLLEQADHNVQALTDCDVLMVPIEDMIGCASAHSSIAIALWREMLIEASIAREWIVNIGRRNARARTAHMLCELAIRRESVGIGPRDTFELPMTQEQLGDALGLTAVHVNRTLKALEGDGVITRSKRSVTVADWKNLRDVGDFSTTYLHLGEGGRGAARR